MKTVIIPRRGNGPDLRVLPAQKAPQPRLALFPVYLDANVEANMLDDWVIDPHIIA